QFLQTLVLFLRSNLAGLGLYRLDSLASVLDRSLLILIAGSLLWVPAWRAHFSLWWFVLAQTAAYLLAAGFLLALLWPRLQRVVRLPQWPLVAAMLRASAPYALAVFLMTLYTRVDAVMIERLHPTGLAENDHYAAAYRLLDAANLAGFLLAGLLLPMFARLIKEKMSVAPLTRLGLQTIWTGAISLAVSCWWLATPIMEGLYVDGNAYSGHILQWLMLTFIPVSGGYVYGTLLVAAGELRTLNRFYLAGVLLNVLLNALLIPRWGAMGAAWATFATQSGIFAAQLGLSVRHLALPVNPPLVVRILLFTALLAAAGYGWREWTGDWHWLVKFTGSVCTGGLLAFVFRLLDLKSWLQWLGKGG
ncbi:MAG: polysaccharide biosynthesis C-terminal domain-containing protein, partial [Lewinella sp.]|nr:polysaccharide biosynthesis C-terminal domain-containing protein [Lewinella sp.]